MNQTVTVIGAGQAGLAVGYWLRRLGVPFTILDANEAPGGAWRAGWDGLRLFSPARYSSLPGVLMPGGPDHYPPRDEVVAYLAEYERRYGLPVERPVRVSAVRAENEVLALDTSAGTRYATAVISATGTLGAPSVPRLPGQRDFQGEQLHSSQYRAPGAFAGRRVLVVGGGNSGAQILAEVSQVTHVGWATLQPPRFLPDDVDGRTLFDAASARYRAIAAGETAPPPSLGDVVMVPSVKAARERGVLQARAMFQRFTPRGVVWPDGQHEDVDAVVWCTGFQPDLAHLAPLGVVENDGRVRVNGTRSVREGRLWLVGYGSWTGFASATLIGVGRSARATAREVLLHVEERKRAGT